MFRKMYFFQKPTFVLLIYTNFMILNRSKISIIQIPILMDWLDYIIKDIHSYNELTKTEQSIIPQQLFNTITK